MDDRVKKDSVSAVIIVFLAMQGAVSFASIEKLGWPFVNYPMYSWAHHFGETVDRYTLVGILEDGTEAPILAEDLHLNFWEYLWGPVEALKKGYPEKLKSFLPADGRFKGRLLTSVRLENRAVRFTKSGPSFEESRTVRVMTLQPKVSP